MTLPALPEYSAAFKAGLRDRKEMVPTTDIPYSTKAERDDYKAGWERAEKLYFTSGPFIQLEE